MASVVMVDVYVMTDGQENRRVIRVFIVEEEDCKIFSFLAVMIEKPPKHTIPVIGQWPNVGISYSKFCCIIGT